MNAIREFAPTACRLEADVGCAPVRTRLLRRALAVYCVLFVIGLVPVVFDASAAWQAFGIGLWLPGAGFLAAGPWGVLHFAVTLILFAIASFVRFATGALAFPIFVWLGAAALAALTVGDAMAPWASVTAGAVVCTFALAFFYSGATKRRHQLAARERRNQYLPTAVAESAQRAMVAPAVNCDELSPRELAISRYVLDRALQPVDQFQGFTHLDQFQPAALRYQLNFLHYSLALQQCQFTPNFHGYLSLGQRQLLEKFQDRRVWGYWIYEALLGRFSLDFDPIGWDNIMLGGFFNLNLSLYASNTGDYRYCEPGALRFRLNGRKTYLHDAHDIHRISARNFQASQLGLYPCEPTFVYPYCNLLGLGGIVAHDRVFGGTSAATISQRFRKHLTEDFTGLDGSIKPGIDRLTGTSIEIVAGLYTELGYAWLANPHFPDIAQRTWAIARTEGMTIDDAGDLQLRMRSAADNLDLGNYRKSELTTLALVAIAAREMGDEEIASAALRRMDRVGQPITDGGILRYNASTYTNAHIALAHFMRRDAWRTTLTQGPSPATLKGPILTEAKYPDVLVARAVSDGADLSLVLYPGLTPGPQTIRIERLRPGQAYVVAGERSTSFTADNTGAAELRIELRERTELRIAPKQ